MDRFISDMRATSLMYHDVVERGEFLSSGFSGPAADAYKLETAVFRRHLETIRRSPEIIERAQTWTGNRLFLTFDDGGASFQSIAAILETFGWRGHFFITTDRIGSAAFLDAAQIRDLRQRGHVIGSHSCTHPRRITNPREWLDSLERLAGILGEPVRIASVPGGFYSRRVAETAAASGIEVLFNSEPTSRPHVVAGCLVLGRYAIRHGMPPERSRDFAENRILPCAREAIVWRAKQIVKALAPTRALPRTAPPHDPN
jgi:peptidoglycan/xylan/chitin deacetylase (PgdA/CDA1 family)